MKTLAAICFAALLLASAAAGPVGTGTVYVNVAAPPGCEGINPELRVVSAEASVSDGLIKAVAVVQNPWCTKFGPASLEAELVDSKGVAIARAASPEFSLGNKTVVEKELFFDAKGLSGAYAVRIAVDAGVPSGATTAFLRVPAAEPTGVSGLLSVFMGLFSFF